MIPGVYIVGAGHVEAGRRFDSLAKAQQVMVAHDMVVLVGDKGNEIGRWIKREDGTLVAVQKSVEKPRPLSPEVEAILSRMGKRQWYSNFTRGPATGPNGRAWMQEQSAAGRPDAGRTTPELPTSTTAEVSTPLSANEGSPAAPHQEKPL